MKEESAHFRIIHRINVALALTMVMAAIITASLPSAFLQYYKQTESLTEDVLPNYYFFLITTIIAI
jgi:hypothetical protein